jgi:hypothetical protein
MTYTIIGGDGKEYGFISPEDIRKWVAENRLNAQSLVKSEGDAEFRPLSTFPEFADVFAPRTPGTIAPPGSATYAPSGDWITRDYELDIGECVKRGWNLFKNDMGILFSAFLIAILVIIGAGMVMGVISGIIPKSLMSMIPFQLTYNMATQALLALLQGPILGGLFYVYIQRMRGLPTGAGDVFVGFQRAYGRLFLGNFVVAFLVGLCLLPFNIVFMMKAGPILDQLRQITPGSHPDLSQLWPVLMSTLPIGLACLIPVTYLTISWQFTLPIIIDKQMDFWEAMKTSFKRVNKHWFQVFGFTVVIALINMAGLCVCCIGVIFTAPMTIAMTIYAYETIFGESQTS